MKYFVDFDYSEAIGDGLYYVTDSTYGKPGTGGGFEDYQSALAFVNKANNDITPQFLPQLHKPSGRGSTIALMLLLGLMV